jgi:predicted Ser/Thr protein kinase
MTQTNEWVGRSIAGRYKIEELLGKGGMSVVYKAFDPNLQRPVAIKMIHAHLSQNPEFVGRFEAEAAAVAKLRHPNIVQVYDFNHDGEAFYMVMELVEGESLFDRLEQLNKDQETLSIKDSIHYMLNVSEAADYAHQKMMYHRDIKPANVIITPQNQAVLMDFGIAKIVGGQTFTQAGAVIGTVKYMAPEQIRGEKSDQRADIYAIGVMLFELLAGRAPFDAGSATTLMMMHLKDPVPNLQEIKPSVPANLVKIVEKALEKDPENRYHSAGDLAKALQKVLIQFEHKEAELFKTVKLDKEDIAAMTAPTAVAPVYKAPETAEEAPAGKTQIIGFEPVEAAASLAAGEMAEHAEAAEVMKTQAVSQMQSAEEEVKKTVKISADELAKESMPAPEMATVEKAEAAKPAASPKMGVDMKQAAAPTKRKLSPLMIGGIVIVGLVILAVLAGSLGIFGGAKGTVTSTAQAALASATSGTAAKATQAATTAAPVATTAAPVAITEAPAAATEAPAAATEAPAAATEAPVATTEAPAAATEAPVAATAALLGNPQASQPGEIFFQENFDGPEALNNFKILAASSAGNNYSVEVANGELQMTIPPAKANLLALYNPPLQNPDVSLETTFHKTAGPNSNRIGLICRFSKDGYYALSVTTNGNWLISLVHSDGVYLNSTILAQGTSKAIQLLDGTNQLAATCAGDQLTLSVNQTELGTITDATLGGAGQVGIVIVGEFPDLSVSFDYLNASVPE